MLVKKQNFIDFIDFYLPKIITNADLFQIDDIVILFKGAFDKIWNNNTYLEKAVKASSTNICRICPEKLQKIIT